MSDEQTLQEEITRADEAKRLLDHPLIQEAHSKINSAVIGQLERTHIKGNDATIAQQQLIMLLQTHKQYIRHFETIIETGMMARDKLFGSR